MHALSIDLLTSDEVMAKSAIRHCVYKRWLLQAVCAASQIQQSTSAAKQLFQLGDSEVEFSTATAAQDIIM